MSVLSPSVRQSLQPHDTDYTACPLFKVLCYWLLLSTFKDIWILCSVPQVLMNYKTFSVANHEHNTSYRLCWSQQTCLAKCISCLTLSLLSDSPPQSRVLDPLFSNTRGTKYWSPLWHVTVIVAKVHMCQGFPERENGPQHVHDPCEHHLHCCIVRLRSTLSII